MNSDVDTKTGPTIRTVIETAVCVLIITLLVFVLVPAFAPLVTEVVVPFWQELLGL
jgi:hypothetical protein